MRAAPSGPDTLYPGESARLVPDCDPRRWEDQGDASPDRLSKIPCGCVHACQGAREASSLSPDDLSNSHSGLVGRGTCSISAWHRSWLHRPLRRNALYVCMYVCMYAPPLWGIKGCGPRLDVHSFVPAIRQQSTAQLNRINKL